MRDGIHRLPKTGLTLQQGLGLAMAQAHDGDVRQGDASVAGVNVLAVACRQASGRGWRIEKIWMALERAADQDVRERILRAGRDCGMPQAPDEGFTALWFQLDSRYQSRLSALNCLFCQPYRMAAACWAYHWE